MDKMSAKEICSAVGGRIISKETDVYACDICINSKDAKKGDLFVPIIGEKTDGHKYIKDATAIGSSIYFTSDASISNIDGACGIYVEETVKALQKLAIYYRTRYTLPIIGVTGSVGKTTTREMTATALSAGKKVYKTKKNLNSQIGVPMTILGLDSSYDIAVVEMGVSMFHEMEHHAYVVKPNAAIVTNIGYAHIENLHSIEHIMEEKLKIAMYMKTTEHLILNGDDKMLSTYEREDVNVLRYYIEKHGQIAAHSRDIYATNIIYDELYNAHFDAIIYDEKVHVDLSIPGEHQISNALAALSCCYLYGVDLEKAASMLHEYKAFDHREKIFKVGDVTIIDDTYNASPASMKAALEILTKMKCSGRRVAVLADMKELGEDEISLHEDIGHYINENVKVDILMTYGKLAKSISNIAQVDSKYHFDDKDELDEAVAKLLHPEDIVLFKGSNSMRLFDSVDKMLLL